MMGHARQNTKSTYGREGLTSHFTRTTPPPHTMRTTATALYLSVAEYCCPVWARSTHCKLVDTPLNEICRLITGCIRPTATPDLYVLSGIAPPEIRRSVHCQNERTKQLTDQRHSLHHHQPVKSRLHSRNSFVSTSQPLLCKPAEARVTKWQNQWEATQSNLKKYDIHRVHGGRPTECARDRLPPRQRNICGATVRTNTVCAAQPMRSEPYHDEQHTFRGDTKQRRHRRNGGSSCAMDERCCRHDMMMTRTTENRRMSCHARKACSRHASSHQAVGFACTAIHITLLLHNLLIITIILYLLLCVYY